MRIADIEAFVTVVRYGSLGLAAQVLGISQATMSRRIQSLEDNCGGPLLDRSTRPAVLTAKGQKVASACHRILEETQGLRILLAKEHQVSGDIHIGLGQNLAELLVKPIFEAASDLWVGQLRPAITTDGAPTLIKGVDQGALDFAVVVLPGASVIPENLKSQCLLEGDLAVIGRAIDWPDSSRISLADCASFGWVVNPDGCGFRSTLMGALQDHGLPLTIRLTAYGTQLQLAGVVAGAGLGLLPRFMVEHLQLPEGLVALKVRDFQPPLAVHALQRNEPGALAGALDALCQMVHSKISVPARDHFTG